MSTVLDSLEDKLLVGDDCWEWTGATTGGYGTIRRQGRTERVHRVVYELLVGPIPDGMTLDHLCHNADAMCAGGKTCRHRRCASPHHLALATRPDNSRGGGRSARATCRNGHPWTPLSTRVTHKDGYEYRSCRICDAESHRRHYQGSSQPTRLSSPALEQASSRERG